MIQSKIFDNEVNLNYFVRINEVKVISIETTKKLYDTGLPLPKGGTFITDRQVLKLWFDDSPKS